jgi:hypothetical protein
VATTRRSRLASPPDPEGQLRLVEARLIRLEGDVAAVKAGGRPRPPSPPRAAMVARLLLIGGAVLVVAAIFIAAR